MFTNICDKYLSYNEGELENLKEFKKTNQIPILKDLAQVVDAKSFIKEGMILIRKHPRFCYVRKHKHNYLEVNYILSGEITQILDKNQVMGKAQLLSSFYLFHSQFYFHSKYLFHL